MEQTNKAKQWQWIHERKLTDAVDEAVSQMIKEQGEIPAPFAFFAMGSAGREEQIHESDQDHGLIYDGDETDMPYFLRLGEKLVEQLEQAGYERCIGGVMASRQRWCKTRSAWVKQMNGWLAHDSFENLRYILTFFDARTVYGEMGYIDELKKVIFDRLKAEPRLLKRFAENTGRLPQGLNLFGQLLVEQHGNHQGALNLKQQVFFPYVNGMRLLALKGNITASSTQARFQTSKDNETQEVGLSFEQLLEKRAEWKERFNSVTYLYPEKLNKKERKQLKDWIKEGRQFYENVQKKLEAGDDSP